MPSIKSICAYCQMTGFKDWRAYQLHLREEENYRRTIPKYTKDEKEIIVKKVEQRMKDYMILPEDIPQQHTSECRCEICLQQMLDAILVRLAIQ